MEAFKTLSVEGRADWFFGVKFVLSRLLISLGRPELLRVVTNSGVSLPAAPIETRIEENRAINWTTRRSRARSSGSRAAE
jgi:hypothetical protein